MNTANATQIEVPSGPSDTVQQIAWSPVANYFSAASWDGETRIWEVPSNGVAIPKTMIKHQAPALCTGWSPDGTKVVAAGCDKTGRLLDLNTGQTLEVLAHDDAVTCSLFLQISNSNSPVVLTGGWDRVIKFWDLRQPNPAHIYQTNERCFCTDTIGILLVVATSNRKVLVFNLQNPTQLYKTIESSQKHETTCISCFTDATGFCLGTIEGRCHVQYIDDNATSVDDRIYPVNSISFNPIHGTFSTAGGDCNYFFWDKDSRQKLKTFNFGRAPITASAFNAEGNIFAFASGDDWSKGYQASNNYVPSIWIQPVKVEDIRPKNALAKKR